MCAYAVGVKQQEDPITKHYNWISVIGHNVIAHQLYNKEQCYYNQLQSRVFVIDPICFTEMT